MSYKIPGNPSSQAYKEETADFWEIQAICNPGLFVSNTNISKIITKELDEINHDGIVSEDDLVDDKIEEVFSELQNRIQFTAGKYPFEFSKYSIKINESPSINKEVYLFLLLCTRLNMLKNKVHNGIDGTLLFEQLCAVVASNFWGINSSAQVFGTATSGGFEEKVKNLIRNIGEGKAFTNPNKNSPTQKDDSIDIVVWKNFADKRIGKLIGFGQCKTGTTSWRDGIKKLNPIDFCTKWLHQQPVLSPVPLVFISDTMNEDFNFYTSQLGFLVFNRFRILEYSESIPQTLLSKISSWVQGAMTTLDIKH